MAEAPLIDTLATLRAQAASAGHRVVIVLEGRPSWCRQQAAAIAAAWEASPALWVGEHGPDMIAPLAWGQAKGWLGRELGCLVVDAFDGVDADGLAALSGTLRAAGLLLLLVPSLAKWGEFADPQHARLAGWPHAGDAVTGRFLQRLGRCVAAQPGVLIHREGQPFCSLAPSCPAPSPAAREPAPPPYAHQPQQQAVAAIHHVVQGHRRRPLVLIADRGRGKSAALGIAAAQLMQQGRSPILLSGPSLEAVAQVFEHARSLLPGANRQRGRLDWQDRQLRFVAPDELLQTLPASALLLVDEAAALPLPMLEAMLRHYARLVFATTVHGYEGSGRGFVVRFTARLDRLAPGWRAVRIEPAIRWADGDPLEALSLRGLLLDAEAVASERVADARTPGCTAEWLERQALADNETDLCALAGLLQLAHYRTRPNDLRHLLDAPDLAILVLRWRGEIVATALVGEEGGLDVALAEAVYRGERRLHGHLLPQSLAVHAGFPEAATLRAVRIIRLAVHPACQRRGLGRRMLQAVRARFARHDYLGASFGADPGLLAFWQSEGLLPMRLGLRREASSGAHAVMVAAALSAGTAPLLGAIHRHFCRQLPVLLREPLQGLDPELVVALLSTCASPDSEHLSEQDWRDIASFVHAGRGYEVCMAPLQRLALARGRALQGLEPAGRDLLIQKVIQQQGWAQCATQAGLTGRAEALAALREVFKALLDRV